MDDIKREDIAKARDLSTKITENKKISQEDLNFLVEYQLQLEKRLANADMLALAIDVQIAMSNLGSRSAVGDARLEYGTPNKYLFISQRQMDIYKKRFE